MAEVSRNASPTDEQMAGLFGYLTRRGESELLVRLTEERKPLVYPNLYS